MNNMLWTADLIDRLSKVAASAARWALLANALLITFNALARKLFSTAYPSAFDLQWHFFAAVVLLMAAYALQRDEHVRVDILAGHLGDRGLAWLDLFGAAFCLIPLCILMVWASWPGFADAWLGNETRAARDSTSSLPAWIMKGLVLLSFTLLALQGVAQAIRCIAHLRGVSPRPERTALVGPIRD
jgi:TRAP-type mannitol/chloroaromatic compound transport system permease small subunit